ncbi:bacteriohemerythrin [Massilia sp. Root351]|jgi:hemerythrin|uniref:bacteriohemerythrin n=1 Tax=Massilia sp. Root351 TaxID=1736522 RepID=UPI000A834FCB|nr:hemerythrin family protein [Massilia sp. Root351]
MTTKILPSVPVLGQPAIDTAHLALAGRVVQMTAGSDGELEAGLPALVDEIEADFRAEDALMEEIAFPGIQAHREQHARVLAALHHVDPRDPAAARRALGLLMEWFQLHVATMDNVLAIALELAACEPAQFSAARNADGVQSQPGAAPDR